MQLLDLPTDLLVALPFYLDSVNDLYSLITTCRSLHITCHATKASLPLRPREQDGQYSVRPYPHLLIAGAARQVGDWAVQSIENRNAFHSALMRGIGGLLELSVNVGRMNLAEMQRLHRIKYDILIPLSKVAEVECTRSRGPLLSNAMLCLLNWWIYSDLFHHAITASYQSIAVPAPLSGAIRVDYLRYCVTNYRGRRWPDVDEDARRRGETTQINDLKVLQDWSTSFNRATISILFGYDTGSSSVYIQPHYHIVQVLQHQGLLTLRILRSRLRVGDGRDEVAHKEAAALLTHYEDRVADAEAEELRQDLVQAYSNADEPARPCATTGAALMEPPWRDLGYDIATLRDERARLGTL